MHKMSPAHIKINDIKKKQMTAVINKLMWITCVLISVTFLAMSYIVVGDQKKLAIAATTI